MMFCIFCVRYTKQARYQPSGDPNPVAAPSQNNNFGANAGGYGTSSYGAPGGGGPSSQRYGGGASVPVASGGFGAAPLGPIGGASVASGSNFGYGGDSSNAAGGLGPSTQYTRAAQNDPAKLQQSRFSRLAQFGMANAGQPPPDQSALGGLNSGASNVLGGNYGRHKF